VPDIPHVLQGLDPNRPWYRFEAVAGAPKRARVSIYDVIGGWFGVNTPEFVAELNALDVDEIELHLNSPGGAAWDGIAIMNALRQHKATVQVVVDGLAASAASVIMLGGDEVVMARGSQVMIHDASGGAFGPAAFVRKTADVLDKLSGNYAGIYAKRAGGDPKDWRELMLAETWYDAEEAVAAGLADRTDEAAEVDEEATAAFDLSVFNYAGRAAAPAPLNVLALAAAKQSPHAPVSSEPGQQDRKEEPLMEEFLSALRQRLGVTNAEADTVAVLAALDEALAERATITPPAGTVLIDQAALAGLQADASAGRQAREEQITARRDGVIAAALREGRITAASAAEFRAQLDVNEAGTTAILATLAKNMVPVSEVGSALGGESSEEDRLYESLFGKEA